MMREIILSFVGGLRLRPVSMALSKAHHLGLDNFVVDKKLPSFRSFALWSEDPPVAGTQGVVAVVIRKENSDSREMCRICGVSFEGDEFDEWTANGDPPGSFHAQVAGKEFYSSAVSLPMTSNAVAFCKTNVTELDELWVCNICSQFLVKIDDIPEGFLLRRAPDFD
jgi:hypothetical protein